MAAQKHHARAEAEDDGRTEAPLHEDILEEIISHVTPLDLYPASRVSPSWRRAVSSSLRRHPRRRIPWLLLHLHSPRHPRSLTRAFDPQSQSWISIPSPHPLLPRSSHPALLHSLSPSDLAFSTDAFGAAWRRLPPPRIRRTDPVVALVGSRLVVAGGGAGELVASGDDPSSVEIHRDDGGGSASGWEACEPIPEAFRGSASATCLSVAASETELYVLEKRSGMLSSFNPEAKRWGKTFHMRPDQSVFLAAVGFAGGRLILVAAAGEATDVESVTLYEVGREAAGEAAEIGRMPAALVERMVGDGWGLASSIGFLVVGDFGYLYNPSDLKEVFLCEFGIGSCRWTSVGVPAAVGENPLHEAVLRCAAVGMDDLKRISSPATIMA